MKGKVAWVRSYRWLMLMHVHAHTSLDKLPRDLQISQTHLQCGAIIDTMVTNYEVYLPAQDHSAFTYCEDKLPLQDRSVYSECRVFHRSSIPTAISSIRAILENFFPGEMMIDHFTQWSFHLANEDYGAWSYSKMWFYHSSINVEGKILWRWTSMGGGVSSVIAKVLETAGCSHCYMNLGIPHVNQMHRYSPAQMPSLKGLSCPQFLLIVMDSQLK